MRLMLSDNKDILLSSLLLLAGLCVLEWCGSVLEGATHEEVRRILAATNHQEEIEFIVKECR